ncbi:MULTISPECIES: hypothetical protein [Streptomyces]|uniref:IrrE N-terminal-like domain-containing protein n=1 Tax=Streptomyces katrae TaxID=68223 RepID=A0A0F4K1V5_9ACTN|nr:hypothetical protein [Streptomyces katrae]KJY39211.1 hypothetical protein VR44_01965 [Streptomyces katrae]
MRWRSRGRGHIRTDVADVVDELTIPQPFNLDDFCANISAQRKRPLLVLPLDGPADTDLPCGIWVGLDTADLVFYEAGAADILKIQIVLHEIAHMLLGHVSPQLHVSGDADDEPVTVSEHFRRFLARTGDSEKRLDPDPSIAKAMRAEAARIKVAAARPTSSDIELGLSTDRILHLLGRTKFEDRQEEEAETLATLILERASRNEAISTTSDASDVLARLNDALGRPGSWT